MNTTEGRAWHALAGARGVGSRTLWKIAGFLAAREKTASWLLQDFASVEVALGLRQAGITLPELVASEYAETGKYTGRQVTVIHPLHGDFPQRLPVLKDAVSLPALLYVRGNLAILNRPGVSIVGRRQASEAALAVAIGLAGELAGKGINITSGYAAGIDTAAHLAALRGNGTTAMVLAEGIHHFQVKPELLDHLTVDNNLVISQFEPDAKWAAYMAMTRNKLVGALSGAVLVVASGPERDGGGRMSGTFDAGSSALKMGVPLFVVTPGFFADRPEGNRQLIAKGGREWDPAAGAAPILAAIETAANKNSPKQLELF